MFKAKILLIVLMAIFLGCQTGDVVEENSKGEKDKTDYPSKYVNGYELSGEDITFYFHPELFGKSNVKKAEIRGTFTNWSRGNSIVMENDPVNGVWKVQKKISEIDIPGNSGSPEFKFLADGGWLQPNNLQPKSHKFSDSNNGNNNRIVSPEDSIEELEEIFDKALRLITEYENDEDLSNFRNVVTGRLAADKFYRSYHPFILSKTNHPREADRVAKVAELMKNKAVKSVINLGDSKEEIDKNGTDYYKDLLNKDNVLMLPEATYNVFYYESGKDEFKEVVKAMGEFVNKHEAPFLVHCRLGTDRTGVTAAIFQALCGAKWEEIADDYERSNNLGLKDEYRNRKLLKYSLKQMLKLSKIDDEDVLEEKMTAYFKSTGLTDAQINGIKDKLTKQ